MARKDFQNIKHLADMGVAIAIAAHELRNPLGVIRAAVYNIKHKAKGEPIASHLNNIDKKITECDIVIKSLLNHAKIIAPQYKPVLIRDLIAECVSDFKVKYSMSDITVNMRCGCKKGDRIDADSMYLTSLFLNILDNSYQSFRGKKGIIDVEVIYNKADNRLQIDFKDNGHSISKSIGLGLAVCNQIVNMHNGKIDIISKKSQGTIVSIALPISRK